MQPPRPARPIARRAALGLGAAALTAGCTNPAGTPGDRRTVRSADLDPDVREALAVLTSIEATARALRAHGTARPALAATLAPLLEVLDAHAAQLRQAVPADPTGGESAEASPGTSRPAALRQVRRQVRSLQGDLVESAIRAQSGRFAALLASMNAALAQQLAVLGAPR